MLADIWPEDPWFHEVHSHRSYSPLEVKCHVNKVLVCDDWCHVKLYPSYVAYYTKQSYKMCLYLEVIQYLPYELCHERWLMLFCCLTPRQSHGLAWLHISNPNNLRVCIWKLLMYSHRHTCIQPKSKTLELWIWDTEDFILSFRVDLLTCMMSHYQ